MEVDETLGIRGKDAIHQWFHLIFNLDFYEPYRLGHVIFLYLALSIGMEDEFLQSMQESNQGTLRFITVCGVGDDAAHN